LAGVTTINQISNRRLRSLAEQILGLSHESSGPVKGFGLAGLRGYPGTTPLRESTLTAALRNQLLGLSQRTDPASLPLKTLELVSQALGQKRNDRFGGSLCLNGKNLVCQNGNAAFGKSLSVQSISGI
jgi:hypothetical protein